jgi:CRISPR-associated protein Csh2
MERRMSKMINQNNGQEIIKNNSEILFIYDAKMCNPNGDPDDENKPRMDYDRGINLVSDLRLKRYIRDYLMDYKSKSIFVCKVDGTTVDATGRLKYLYFLSQIVSAIDSKYNLDMAKVDVKIKKILDEKTREEKLREFINDLKNNKRDTKQLSSYINLSEKLNLKISGSGSDLKDIKDSDIAQLSDRDLLSELIDVRYFGATMPIKSEEGGGSSRAFTGPIQFNWGYSLNKVTGSMDSNAITSTFGGATDEYSGMGKDFRVAYSIIAFYGIISAKRAEHTYLTEDDIKLFDEAMRKAIPLEATTRSKMNQTPLLCLRVEYNNKEFFLGDLRRYVKLVDHNNKEIPFKQSTNLGSLKEYKLDLSDLKDKLDKVETEILEIHFWKHEDIGINGWDLKNEKK